MIVKLLKKGNLPATITFEQLVEEVQHFRYLKSIALLYDDTKSINTALQSKILRIY